MTECNVETIEKAIAQFYHSSEDRQKTHSWLSSIQVSQEAWQFCWVLISNEKPPEVQFFGASTLQNKILKYWHEVSVELIEQLQVRLLNSILQFGSSPGGKLIANKLCLAMSGVILHTITEHWPDAVTQIISTFQTCETISAEVRCKLLLEVLIGLVEQFPHAHFGIRNGRRAAVHLKVMQQFDDISVLLASLLGPDVPADVVEAALRCVSSWVEFGVKLDQMEVLLEKSFLCLQNVSVFETAVDTLIAAFTKNQPQRFPKTIRKYFAEVVKLLPFWKAALEEENLEWCRDISRLVINLSEENVNILADLSTGCENEKQLCMDVIGMVMTFTDIKGNFPADETLSDLSFGFWYMLEDVIQSETDEQKVEQYMKMFRPVYMELMQVLLRKAQYPDESVFHSMSMAEKEQFRCYRQDIADTIMYTNCMLRESVLTLLKGCVLNFIQHGAAVRWQEVECVLHILSSVTTDSLSLDEEDWEIDEQTDKLNKTRDTMLYSVMVDVVNLVTNLKIDNKALLISVLQVLGAFSEQYDDKPEVLGIVLPVILVHGLSYADTVLFATTALKDICRDNGKLIAPHADGILTVACEKLASFTLSPRNCARLLSSVGYVLSELPQHRIFEWLNKILPPVTESLGQAASLPPNCEVKSQLLDKLQMLTFLFDSLDVKREDSKQSSDEVQPVLVILKDILPTLNIILSNWVTDSNIVECVVELIKKSLSTLMEDFKPLLADITVLLVKIYDHKQYTVILDIIRQLVLMFMKDVATFDTVKDAFHSVALKTMMVLQQETRANTDLLEAYAVLCVQMSKKSAAVIIDSHFPLELTVATAVSGILLPEAPTMKACCSLLGDFISKRNKYVILDTVIPKISITLYDTLIKCIAGAAPRTNSEYTVPVFIAMNVSYFDVASASLQLLLSQPGYPLPQPTMADKQRFMKDVLKERSSKRRLRDTISMFSMICRGIAGTQYAEETAFSMQFR